MKIVISCGGTGGHVFPGLAVAEELDARKCSVTVLGTGRDIESEAMKAWTGSIENTGLSGYSRSSWPGKILLLMVSLKNSISILRRIDPEVLVAMGGYASFGPVVAARILSIPIVLHEGNAVPGRATRFLAFFATCVAVNYEMTAGLIRHRSVSVAGFPVRRSLIESAKLDQKPHDPGLISLLVLGGSQGAGALNAKVPEAVKAIKEKGRKIKVIHIAGLRDEEDVRKRYAGIEADVDVLGFVCDMDKIYSRADAAISRAGASALAELAVYGIPAMLIPFPFASDDHQKANAMHYAQGGGVEVVDQADFSVERCCAFVESLADSPAHYERMSNGMLACSRVSAAGELADIVEKVAEEQRNADI